MAIVGRYKTNIRHQLVETFELSRLVAAFNAATTAWHLCDWIKTYPKLHPGSGLEIDPSKYRAEVLERCPWLELCQQIANGWKHRVLDQTNVPKIQANSVIDIFARIDADGNPCLDERPFKYEQSYAVWDGQQHIDLATLFDTVLGFWNDELTRLKLDQRQYVEPDGGSRTVRMGMRFIVALILVLASTAALAEPIRQTFKDASGRELGGSTTDAHGNTTFRDAMGRNTGRSVTSGGITTVYDQMGRQTGTIRGSK